MKRRRHTPEQIIRKLREAEQMLSEGKSAGEAAKALGVSEQSLRRWRNQYGGMKAGDVKRLKELERENGQVKRLVADTELEVLALKEIAKGLLSPTRRRKAFLALQDRLGLSECRACRIADQNRSTQRHLPKVARPQMGGVWILSHNPGQMAIAEVVAGSARVGFATADQGSLSSQGKSGARFRIL